MSHTTTLLFTLGGRIALAGVICGMLGLEREMKNKGAGLRTHILVGLASALVIVVSQYGYDAVIRTGVVLDPSRTAAQVVSGIGFLGAGIIFVKRDIVHGLTTAAGIWLSAAIGLAAGAGLILLSVFTGVLALTAIYTLGLVERHIIRSKDSFINMTLLCEHKQGVVAQVSAAITSAGFIIENLVLNRKSLAPDTFEMEFDLGGGGDTQDLFAGLCQLDCVLMISGIQGPGNKTRLGETG